MLTGSSATSYGHVKRPHTAATSPDQSSTKESMLTRPKTPAGGTTTNTPASASNEVTDSPKVVIYLIKMSLAKFCVCFLIQHFKNWIYFVGH